MQGSLNVGHSPNSKENMSTQKTLAMCVRCGYINYMAYIHCAHSEGQNYGNDSGKN